MAFSQRFPQDVPGQNYPKWVEIKLSSEEETGIERDARIENYKLMVECLADAKNLLKRGQVHSEPPEIVSTAIALFEKRASHHVYWKERKAKEKFDSLTSS